MKVSQSEVVQKQLQQEGVMTMHGEWPYLEWNSGSQSSVESLEDPLSMSQLISGLGDVIARLEADVTQVTMFKTSRPLSDKMTGGSGAPSLSVFMQGRDCRSDRFLRHSG